MNEPDRGNGTTLILTLTLTLTLTLSPILDISLQPFLELRQEGSPYLLGDVIIYW